VMNVQKSRAKAGFVESRSVEWLNWKKPFADSTI